MKIETSELIGAQLDWAVAKCEEMDTSITPSLSGGWNCVTDWFQPSRKWMQGGPIIERRVTKIFKNVGGTYTAQIRHEKEHELTCHKMLDGWTNAAGPTMLAAAMRCYVASKLGDIVDIPDELK